MERTQSAKALKFRASAKKRQSSRAKAMSTCRRMFMFFCKPNSSAAASKIFFFALNEINKSGVLAYSTFCRYSKVLGGLRTADPPASSQLLSQLRKPGSNA